MTEQEYINWIWLETFKGLASGAATYAITLIAYWGFVA